MSKKTPKEKKLSDIKFTMLDMDWPKMRHPENILYTDGTILPSISEIVGLNGIAILNEGEDDFPGDEEITRINYESPLIQTAANIKKIEVEYGDNEHFVKAKKEFKDISSEERSKRILSDLPKKIAYTVIEYFELLDKIKNWKKVDKSEYCFYGNDEFAKIIGCNPKQLWYLEKTGLFNTPFRYYEVAGKRQRLFVFRRGKGEQFMVDFLRSVFEHNKRECGKIENSFEAVETWFREKNNYKRWYETGELPHFLPDRNELLEEIKKLPDKVIAANRLYGSDFDIKKISKVLSVNTDTVRKYLAQMESILIKLKDKIKSIKDPDKREKVQEAFNKKDYKKALNIMNFEESESESKPAREDLEAMGRFKGKDKIDI
ncbi:MAG: hypothetical protein WCX65_15670 [bacterium]